MMRLKAIMIWRKKKSSARKELIGQLEENLCDVEKGNELIHGIFSKIVCALGVDYEQLERDSVGDFERDL